MRGGELKRGGGDRKPESGGELKRGGGGGKTLEVSPSRPSSLK